MSDNKDKVLSGVVAVLDTPVKAHFGFGSITVVVADKGVARLYGRTALGKATKDMSVVKLSAQGLADRFKVIVIRTKAEGEKFLSDNKLALQGDQRLLDKSDARVTGRARPTMTFAS